MKVIECMISDKSRIWNALELEELYQSHGGTFLSQKLLIEKLSNKMEPDFLILSGVAETNKLEPISLPADVSPAPESILRMIRYGCSSSQPCSTTRCSCSTAHISCSVSCACHGDNGCRNPKTISVRAEENDEFEDADEASL